MIQPVIPIEQNGEGQFVHVPGRLCLLLEPGQPQSLERWM